MALACVWAPLQPGGTAVGQARQMLWSSGTADVRGMVVAGADGNVALAGADAAYPQAPCVIESACGRHILAVEGRVWSSDRRRPVTAATLVEAIARRGLRHVLEDHDGAFVLAHWSRDERCMTLARDRAGQRALYYAWSQGALIIATSLRALRAYPGARLPVNPASLALFLRHGYVPAPHCIVQSAFKMLPGCLLRLGPRELQGDSAAHLPGIDQTSYWQAQQAYEAALQTRGAVDAKGALPVLDRRLHAAVDAARVSPSTGAFLSGGTDSSLVAAVLQAQSDLPVSTLGVGFESPDHDERHWMQAVARHLGVRHDTVVCGSADVLALVERLPSVWDEPFADASQIPTLLASERLAAGCAVALTGDGGDELFCGHGAYLRAMRNARMGRVLPGHLHGLAQRLAGRSPERARLGGWPALLSEAAGQGVAHHYLMRVVRWRAPLALLPAGTLEPRTLYRDAPTSLHGGDDADMVQYLDFAMELGNGILTKTGRAAQATGLQVVAPLLAREMVEQAWALPTALKLRDGEPKWILKKLLCQYLPEPLVYRPKRGFGPPIGQWLRGPLREWASALLDPDNLLDAGITGTRQVQQMWSGFLAGERRWHPLLWTLLMYLAWFDSVSEERGSE